MLFRANFQLTHAALQVCLENWSLCQILRRGGLGRDDDDGRTWFSILGYQIVVQARLFFLEEKSHLHKLIRTCTFINFKDFSHLHVYLVVHIYKARLFFLEEKSHLHNLIRTCTFIDFKDFSHLHVYSGLHFYLVP